jgi:xylulokinase
MHPLFLGLDSSTQSLTAVLIDPAARAVVRTESVNFDADLPAHGTRNGTLRYADPRVVHAPPLLWADALDLLLGRLRDSGAPLGQVRAVAVSGQQHGSVYLRPGASAILAALDPAQPLVGQLGGLFSRPTSPIWMDSSTSAECAEIRAALGGPAGAAAATGSDLCERFTGPQIRRFWKEDPAAYAATASIALVSSFLPTLLAGRVAAIDHGDGAGMNLMDIHRRAWHPAALAATAPDLDAKLPPLAPAGAEVGPLSAYFVRRFGFSPDTRVRVGSGDNPCSVAGLGLIEEGQLAVSLGTSDTCFGLMRACRTDPRAEGHVFVAPSGAYMSLICYKNGSLAREKVRDAHGLDWDGFAAALRATPPGNRGGLMLPWFEPEIVPRVLTPGVRTRGIDAADAAAHVRGVVEAQMLSMKLHAAWMGVASARIVVTGGASHNREVLQVLADVHQCPVDRLEVSHGAALGAALIAAVGEQGAADYDWARAAQDFCRPDPAARVMPRPETAPVYAELARAYAAFEREALPG